jgi:hypothetical protein
MPDKTQPPFAEVVRALTPDQRLLACAKAQLDLRTLHRIRKNRPVRYSSVARLESALRNLGIMEDSAA